MAQERVRGAGTWASPAYGLGVCPATGAPRNTVRCTGLHVLVETRVALGAKVTGPEDPVSVTLNLLIPEIWEEAESVVGLCQNATAATIFPEASLSLVGITYISESSKNCNHEAVG